MAEKLTIKIRTREAGSLIKLLKDKNIDFSTREQEYKFLPSPWKEIIVTLTPALLTILYDFWKSRKSKSEIIIRTNDTSMKLNADGIKELELRLRKKKEGSKTCSPR
jgi:hypothetical protein